MNNRSAIPPIVWIVATAAGVWWAVSAGHLPSPIPDPDPIVANDKIAVVARDAGRDYLSRLADGFESAATSRLDLKRDHDEMQTKNQKARKAAFAPVDDILQDVTPETKREVFESISKGLREAAKGSK